MEFFSWEQIPVGDSCGGTGCLNVSHFAGWLAEWDCTRLSPELGQGPAALFGLKWEDGRGVGGTGGALGFRA